MRKFKENTFRIIQIGNKSDFLSTAFDYFISFVIILNLTTTFLSTFDECRDFYALFDIIELISVLIFTIEYILRLLTSDLLYPDKKPRRALFKFVFSFYGIIDLLSFLPYYLPLLIPSGFLAFRMFRVVRIFRLFKINSQYDAFNVIIGIINDKKNQLLSSMTMIFILMLASSLSMYGLEHNAQPEVFKNAFSGMWWAVSACLTVGYGDIYPITPLGQILAIIIAFLGVGMVAVPTGILSAAFVEEYTKIKNYHGIARELLFVSADLEADHPWCSESVRNICLPPELILLLIQREGEYIEVKNDTVLKAGDRLILGAKNYRDEDKIKLHEVYVGPSSSFNRKKVMATDLRKSEKILLIRRHGREIIPDENTLIKEGDRLVIFSQYQ